MLRRAVSKPNAPAAGGGAALLREQRRKKRIEKAISLLERRGRILKAVVEVSPPYALALDAQKLKRPSNIEGKTDDSAVESERLLLKQWNRYKMFQHMQELQVIQRAFRLQAKAIEELKNISPELSTAALQPDAHLLPLEATGPLASAPLGESYEAADGRYTNSTRTYAKPPDMEAYFASLGLKLDDATRRTLPGEVALRKGKEKDK